jgi:hypothetical protein
LLLCLLYSREMFFFLLVLFFLFLSGNNISIYSALNGYHILRGNTLHVII